MQCQSRTPRSAPRNLLPSSEISRTVNAVCAARALHIPEPRAETVLLTDRRLLIFKRKAFGGAKVALGVDLTDIVDTHSGLLGGVGPTFVMQFRYGPGKRPIAIYFNGPEEAEELERRIREAVSIAKN